MPTNTGYGYDRRTRIMILVRRMRSLPWMKAMKAARVLVVLMYLIDKLLLDLLH